MFPVLPVMAPRRTSSSAHCLIAVLAVVIVGSATGVAAANASASSPSQKTLAFDLPSAGDLSLAYLEVKAKPGRRGRRPKPSLPKIELPRSSPGSYATALGVTAAGKRRSTFGISIVVVHRRGAGQGDSAAAVFGEAAAPRTTSFKVKVRKGKVGRKTFAEDIAGRNPPPALGQRRPKRFESVRRLTGDFAGVSLKDLMRFAYAMAYNEDPPGLNEFACKLRLKTCKKPRPSNPFESPGHATEDTQPQAPPPNEPKPPEDGAAPPIDPSVPTTVYDSTQFLYAGDDPIQEGVDEGTIVPQRAAVIRGRVLDKAGNPLEGAKVTILDHPELGYTNTRQGGAYDLAVNGGGQLTLNYEKDGYLPAQRQIEAPWQDYAVVDDVVLVQPDPKVTEVTANSDRMQVARASAVNDQDGTRQSTLLFPAGTSAEMVLPDGSTSGLETMHVRTTEYTVGDLGLERMPAELPPTTAYTYAAEFTVDEAQAQDAKTVRFSQPVVNYVENFLDMPVGSIVPSGYYDLEKAAWIADRNGRVVKILEVVDGKARLDIDGSGVAAEPAQLAALGIGEEELQTLATIYQPGQSLWRVPLAHFTPGDYNWGYFNPEGDVCAPDDQCRDEFPPPDDPAEDPLVEPEDDENDDEENNDDPCEVYFASTIACESQSVREGPVRTTGTPFTLNYPDEVPGRTSARRLKIRLSRPRLPDGVQEIKVRIAIAGRQFESSYAPESNRKITFTWDGKDAYGRSLNCPQPVTVRVGYTYAVRWQMPVSDELLQAFARLSGQPMAGSNARQELTLWSSGGARLGTCDLRGQGLGGWTISAHHQYDPTTGTVYLGDGSHRKGLQAQQSITTAAGSAWSGECAGSPRDIAAGDDGSYFVAVSGYCIYKVAADGTITTVAGNGTPCQPGPPPERWFTEPCGDGGPATEAQLIGPYAIAAGPDGSLYIDDGAVRIRKVTPAGTITTVAGDGVVRFCPPQTDCGDGGPAERARFGPIYGLAVAGDGSLYVSDSGNSRVRQIGTDGIITTVAGGDTADLSFCFSYNQCGDGGPAVGAVVPTPTGLAVAQDGTLFILTGDYKIRRVAASGVIDTVAGVGIQGQRNGDGSQDDGVPALKALLNGPTDIATGPDGSIYYSEYTTACPPELLWSCWDRVRRIGSDGFVHTVAGGREPCPRDPPYDCGDGGSAPDGRLIYPKGVALSADGSLLIADYGNHRVRRVSRPVPGFDGKDSLIASEDGSQVYHFDSRGRHLETLDALTGKPIYRFGHDPQGRLSSITDRDQNTTRIERDPGTGEPQAIIAPFDQRTALTTNPDGYLQMIANPANDSYSMTYKPGGLLRTFTDPEENPTTFTYEDDTGRLKRDENAVGGSYDLTRTDVAGGHEVKVETALGRSHTPRTQTLVSGDRRRTVTGPTGSQATALIRRNGTKELTKPSGLTAKSEVGADPRWGMQTPRPKTSEVRTPGAEGAASKMLRTSFERSVTLADPADPFSLRSLRETKTTNGRTSTTTYDAPSRTATMRSPKGRTRTLVFNQDARPVQASIGGLLPTTLSYTPRGRLGTYKLGERSWIYAYDPVTGYLSTVTDPLDRVFRYPEYYPSGRLKKKILPGNRVVTYAYDTNGNLTSITPPGEPAHTFTYTPVNLLETYRPPRSGETSFVYNKDKQIELIRRPDGTTIDPEYDAQVGWLDYVTFAGGRIDFTYDRASGNRRSASTGNETVSFGYDGSLPFSETYSGEVQGKVAATYNDDFRATSLNLNGEQEAAFSYDNDGVLTRAGDLQITPDTANGLTNETRLGTVITKTTKRNGYGQTEGYEVKSGDTALLDSNSTYDALGRVDQVEETVQGDSRQRSFTYDDAGRLWKVKKSGQTVGEFQYDEQDGNLKAYIDYADPSRSVTDIQYNEQGRMRRYGDLTYTYNTNGKLKDKTNTQTGKTIAYTYDGLGNLSGIDLPDGTNVSYVYDGMGRLVGKKVDSRLTQGYLYAGNSHPVAELDGENRVIARFVYGNHGAAPAYMEKDGRTYRFITDRLGSPRLVVNAETGEVAERIEYNAFGQVTVDTNPDLQPFKSAGRPSVPETGLGLDAGKSGGSLSDDDEDPYAELDDPVEPPIDWTKKWRDPFAPPPWADPSSWADFVNDWLRKAQDFGKLEPPGEPEPSVLEPPEEPEVPPEEPEVPPEEPEVPPEQPEVPEPGPSEPSESKEPFDYIDPSETDRPFPRATCDIFAAHCAVPADQNWPPDDLPCEYLTRLDECGPDFPDRVREYQDGYSRYVANCLADGLDPLSYNDWLDKIVGPIGGKIP